MKKGRWELKIIKNESLGAENHVKLLLYRLKAKNMGSLQTKLESLVLSVNNRVPEACL
jgi:hypothetical protein